MIEFKILNCPDKSQQSIYQHMGSELVIGKIAGDMIIDDPSIGDTQLRVRLNGGNPTVENLNPELEVRLNGRAIEGESPLKEKDNLTMGRTTINFSRLTPGALEPPPPFEHIAFRDRFSPGTREHAVFEALSFLERKERGSAGSSPPLTQGAAGMPRPPIPRGSPPPIPANMPPPPKKR